MIEAILEQSEKLKSETINCRRHLHSLAEKSFEEHETASFVASKLESFGYSVRTGVAGTGVVAEHGQGVIVALRAELDGLVIRERNSFEYASRNTNVMHACGHDANMACVLTAAQILTSFACGKYRIIMQPASEIASDENLKSGAARMIEEGVLDNVSAVLGLHVDATIASGQIGIIEEPVVPQQEMFSIKIYRDGEAEQRSDWDPARAGAMVVSAIYEGLASVSHGNEKLLRVYSVIADRNGEESVIVGRILNRSKDMFTSIVEKIEQGCREVRVAGGSFAIEFTADGGNKAMDRTLVEIMKQAASSVVGANSVLLLKRKTWAEDFSAYSAIRPGAMLLFGSRPPGPPRSAHTDTFDIDDSKLHLGAAILARAAVMAAEALQEATSAPAGC